MAGFDDFDHSEVDWDEGHIGVEPLMMGLMAAAAFAAIGVAVFVPTAVAVTTYTTASGVVWVSATGAPITAGEIAVLEVMTAPGMTGAGLAYLELMVASWGLRALSVDGLLALAAYHGTAASDSWDSRTMHWYLRLFYGGSYGGDGSGGGGDSGGGSGGGGSGGGSGGGGSGGGSGGGWGGEGGGDGAGDPGGGDHYPGPGASGAAGHSGGAGGGVQGNSGCYTAGEGLFCYELF